MVNGSKIPEALNTDAVVGHMNHLVRSMVEEIKYLRGEVARYRDGVPLKRIPLGNLGTGWDLDSPIYFVVWRPTFWSEAHSNFPPEARAVNFMRSEKKFVEQLRSVGDDRRVEAIDFGRITIRELLAYKPEWASSI